MQTATYVVAVESGRVATVTLVRTAAEAEAVRLGARRGDAGCTITWGRLRNPAADVAALSRAQFGDGVAISIVDRREVAR